jgi:hypothetical protein
MQKAILAKKPITTTKHKPEVLLITPEIAAAWLDTNTLNRKLRMSVVDKYARDMMAGVWKLTYDAIRFDDNGVLLDGQHRLAACVKAGVAFESLVVYGIPADARSAVDIGRSRTTADILAFEGHGNATTLAAMARWLVAIKAGSSTVSNGKMPVTVADIIEVVDRHPKMTMFANSSFYAKRAPSPTLICTMGYIGHELLGETERALAFLAVFRDGVPDYTNCPAHLLREFYLKTRGQKNQLAAVEHFRVTAHVWNLFREKRQLRKFQWPNEVEIEGLNLKKI